ncbi:MAG: PDZ domain-containing protein [Gemmatimonadaceae bacterium]
MRLTAHLIAALALATITVAPGAQEPEPRADREDAKSAAKRTRSGRWRVEADSARAVLGVSLGSSGSKRDTLGVFVQSVNPEGPAAKAGIEEGNRIASINGVNLRLAAEDAGDEDMSGVRVRRLTREMRKVKPGDNVTLEVYAEGKFRTVQVKSARASDLASGMEGFRFFVGDDGMLDGPPALAYAPMPPMPPMPPMAMTPRSRRPMVMGLGRGMGVGMGEGLGGFRVNLVGEGEGYSLSVPDLRLTSVSEELASYFGAGTEKGLLVLEADGRWDDLDAGDVILKVDGKSVKSGDRARLSMDMDEEHTIELIRKGKPMKIGIRD